LCICDEKGRYDGKIKRGSVFNVQYSIPNARHPTIQFESGRNTFNPVFAKTSEIVYTQAIGIKIDPKIHL
jgi:hypothetical protein